jgi:hypothetical protein
MYTYEDYEKWFTCIGLLGIWYSLFGHVKAPVTALMMFLVLVHT